MFPNNSFKTTKHIHNTYENSPICFVQRKNSLTIFTETHYSMQVKTNGESSSNYIEHVHANFLNRSFISTVSITDSENISGSKPSESLTCGLAINIVTKLVNKL